jgi:hypothetical protein
MSVSTQPLYSDARADLIRAVQPAVSTNCYASVRKPTGSFPQVESKLTSPHGKHVSAETMSTDACVYFYEGGNCHEMLKQLAGNYCVFCSYGSVPCPPLQAGDYCC